MDNLTSQTDERSANRRGITMKHENSWLAALLSAMLLSVLCTAASATGDDVAGYGIQPGDVLEIAVWREPELQREVLVRPDGGISFPLVGEVQAQGISISDLNAEITERLQRYLADPVVSITVKEISGNRIYVLGRVNSPGEFIVRRPISVLQALSMAGGLTPFAERDKVKVLRGTGPDQRTFPFDYDAVERGESLDQNIRLLPGDVVVVP